MDKKYRLYDECDKKFAKDWNSRLWRDYVDGMKMSQDWLDVNEYIAEHDTYYDDYSC